MYVLDPITAQHAVGPFTHPIINLSKSLPQPFYNAIHTLISPRHDNGIWTPLDLKSRNSPAKIH